MLNSLQLVALLAGGLAARHAAASSTTNEVVDLEEQYGALANSSLRWLQRPNLYFGMRARVEGDSPLFGLAWFGAHDYAGLQSGASRLLATLPVLILMRMCLLPRITALLRTRRQHGRIHVD